MPRLSQYAVQAGTALSMPAAPTAAGPVLIVDGEGGGRDIVDRLRLLPPSSRVFFYPYSPMLAVLSGKVQVSRHDIMTPYYTTPGQYQEVCEAVMRMPIGWRTTTNGLIPRS